MLIKVAICAGCNTVYPWAAFVIGLVAGLVFMLWSFLIEKLKIDDPLDAVAGIVFLIFFVTVKYFHINIENTILPYMHARLHVLSIWGILYRLMITAFIKKY